jgi:hypothetical protein
LGRRIFVQNSSRFLIVVEGAIGASGQPPGVRLKEPPAFPDGRPDLQIEASNPLGNGDSVTVDCTVPNSDGIAAVEPPNFGPSSDVTNALRDFSCRFQNQSLSQPCLRGTDDEFTLGNPGAAPVVEFCDSVSAGHAFPVGDTMLTVRLRDSALNLGPPEQIIVRVLAP